MPVLERIRSALVHPKAPLGLAVLAFLVGAPALGAGFIVDDHVHRFFARGGTIPGGPRGPWDLYRFADGAGGLREAMESGLHPWWTSPELRLAFFRPVASLLRVFEERAFGDHALLCHLVTSLVFVGTVLAVHAAFRRWIGGAAATLGALLFCIDDAHASTIGWIAARHSLLATGLGALALALYLRARDEKKVSVGAGLAMMGALASSEAALSFLPMFVAIAAAFDPRSARERARALAPVGAAVALWLAVYGIGGFGSRGSGYYVDPVRDPARFVAAGALRLPALAAAQLFVPPSELSSMAAPLAPAIALLGLLVLGVVFAVAARAEDRRRALALAFAFVAALVPACGTNADDRLLMVPGIAAMALVALMCRSAYRARARVTARAALVAVGLVHVLFALVLGPLRVGFFASSMGGFVARGAESLYAGPRNEDEELLVVTAPDGLLPSSMQVSRRNAGLPVAERWRLLLTAPAGDVTLHRVDASTLEISASLGAMNDPFVAAVRAAPFAAGDTVRFPALVVTVLSVTADGRPTKIRFAFARPLDDPRIVAVRWRAPHDGKPSGFERFRLPSVGASMPLDAIDFAKALGGQ